MSLKDSWIDKVDGIDDVLSKDINDIAHAVIKTENDIGNIGTALDSIMQQQISIKNSQEEILESMRGI